MSVLPYRDLTRLLRSSDRRTAIVYDTIAPEEDTMPCGFRVAKTGLARGTVMLFCLNTPRLDQ